MTPLAVTPHPDTRGRAIAYPVTSPWRTHLPWRPARRTALAQISATPGEPTALQRYAHVGIITVGLLTAFLAWPHRRSFGGFVTLSAGAGALGVGLAFLTLDLIGFKPDGERL